MKILAKSKNGKMLKIGEHEKNYKWYFLAPPVIGFSATLNNGDEVDIKHEDINGEATITYITKKDGSASASPSATGGGTTSTYTPRTYGKSPEEQDSIKRQAIGHMTSRTLHVFTGQLDVTQLDVLKNVIKEIYATYVELVG